MFLKNKYKDKIYCGPNDNKQSLNLTCLLFTQQFSSYQNINKIYLQHAKLNTQIKNVSYLNCNSYTHNTEWLLRSPSPTVRSCRYVPMFCRNLLTSPSRWQEPDDGCSRFLQNTVPYMPNNMASHLRRQFWTFTIVRSSKFTKEDIITCCELLNSDICFAGSVHEDFRIALLLL